MADFLNFPNPLISTQYIADGKKWVWDGTAWKITGEILQNFTGATVSADGIAGLVPAPLISDATKFLKGDGTWSPTIEYPLSNQTTQVLRGDGNWSTIANAGGVPKPIMSSTITLLSGTWTGSVAPFSYALIISGIDVNTVVDLIPDPSITAAQLEALQAANIIAVANTSNTVNLRAFGTKPIINIPIRSLIWGQVA
jgi:hypothetical protein